MRIAAITLVLLLLLFAGWRHWRVWSIPDVGDPYDIDAFLAGYEHDRTSMDVFRETLPEVKRIKQQLAGVGEHTLFNVRWDEALPEVRDLVGTHRDLIDKWVAALELPPGVEGDPQSANYDENLPVSFSSQIVVGLMVLDANRLIEEGDLPGARKIYSQIVEVCQHLEHGPATSQSLADSAYVMMSMSLAWYMGQAEVDVDELYDIRTFLAEYDQQKVPLSTTLKFAYLRDRDRLEKELAISSMSRWLFNESEMARRIQQMIYANLLSEADRPESEQSPVWAHECVSLDQPEFVLWLRRQLGQTLPNDNNRYCRFTLFRDGPYREDVDEGIHQLIVSHHWLTLPGSPWRLRFTERNSYYEGVRRVNELQIGLHLYHREYGKFPDSLKDLPKEYAQLVTAGEGNASGMSFTNTEYGYQLGDGFFVWRVYEPGEDPVPPTSEAVTEK
ncbi:MAG: hypothetical protein CMJ46_05195 [Planctomyces sp.]|nr:hypothetical protein [Planctomyces sp.]